MPLRSASPLDYATRLEKGRIAPRDTGDRGIFRSGCRNPCTACHEYSRREDPVLQIKPSSKGEQNVQDTNRRRGPDRRSNADDWPCHGSSPTGASRTPGLAWRSRIAWWAWMAWPRRSRSRSRMAWPATHWRSWWPRSGMAWPGMAWPWQLRPGLARPGRPRPGRPGSWLAPRPWRKSRTPDLPRRRPDHPRRPARRPQRRRQYRRRNPEYRRWGNRPLTNGSTLPASCDATGCEGASPRGPFVFAQSVSGISSGTPSAYRLLGGRVPSVRCATLGCGVNAFGVEGRQC